MDAAQAKSRVEGAVNELRELVDQALTTKSDGEDEKVDAIREKANEAVKRVAEGFEEDQVPANERRGHIGTGATKAESKEEHKAEAKHK